MAGANIVAKRAAGMAQLNLSHERYISSSLNLQITAHGPDE